MNGECALWSQQFLLLLLEGLRSSPALVALLGPSEGPAAALVWDPGAQIQARLGQLQQEHPGAVLSWAQGEQCLLLLPSFSWQCLLSTKCQVMGRPCPTACVLVLWVRGEIASLGTAGEESCSAFQGVAPR